MTGITIRSLTNDDMESVWDIFLSVFPSKYTLEFEDAWETRHTDLTLGACTTDGTIVGFVLTAQKDYDELRVEFLAVRPTVQQGGIGTRLLMTILEYCHQTQSRASLIPVNDPRIIHWYRKHGFQIKGDPFISPYTGDLEQVMEYVHTHTVV